MRFITAVVALLLVNTLPVFAQAPSPDCDLPPAGVTVMNPTRACFEVSPDHATIDGYAIDLVRESDDTVAQTIDMGKPASQATPDGTEWVIWNGLNVMPRSFGTYYSNIRAYAGGVSGPDSVSSNDWDRAPGRPGGPPRVVKGLKWLGKGMWAGLKHSGRGLASVQHIVR